MISLNAPNNLCNFESKTHDNDSSYEFISMKYICGWSYRISNVTLVSRRARNTNTPIDVNWPSSCQESYRRWNDSHCNRKWYECRSRGDARCGHFAPFRLENLSIVEVEPVSELLGKFEKLTEPQRYWSCFQNNVIKIVKDLAINDLLIHIYNDGNTRLLFLHKELIQARNLECFSSLSATYSFTHIYSSFSV